MNCPACEICCNAFDSSLKLPKVLPCGHTICRPCFLQMSRCPSCKTAYQKVPEPPTNFFILQSQAPKPTQLTKCQIHKNFSLLMFCVPCKKSLCIKCSSKHHNHSHEVTSLEDHVSQREAKVTEARERMASQIRQTRDQLEKINDLVSAYEKLHLHPESCLKKVDTFISGLKKLREISLKHLKRRVEKRIRKLKANQEEMQQHSKKLESILQSYQVIQDSDYPGRLKQIETVLSQTQDQPPSVEPYLPRITADRTMVVRVPWMQWGNFKVVYGRQSKSRNGEAGLTRKLDLKQMQPLDLQRLDFNEFSEDAISSQEESPETHSLNSVEFEEEIPLEDHEEEHHDDFDFQRNEEDESGEAEEDLEDNLEEGGEDDGEEGADEEGADDLEEEDEGEEMSRDSVQSIENGGFINSSQ